MSLHLDSASYEDIDVEEADEDEMLAEGSHERSMFRKRRMAEEMLNPQDADFEVRLDDDSDLGEGHHSPDKSLPNRPEDDIAWIDPESRSPGNSPIIAYLNAFFMTIATVLGTGILALPVKLSQTGFTPLLATYTLIFIMQAVLIVFLVEVLQRARVQFQQKQNQGEGVTLDDLTIFATDIEEATDPIDALHEGAPPANFNVSSEPTGSTPGASTSKGEDLHSLSAAYLNPILQKFFDAAIVLHFISLLITYTLAASEAYGQFFGMHSSWIWLAIPFVGLLAPTVIFFSKYLDHIISFFTFSKAGLLVLMVVITAVVSWRTNLTISNDWAYVGRPFLIGTVALGGCYNILPVAFDKVRFHARQVKIFTACSVAGLTLVYIFNLAWCYFILRIVPQVPAPGQTSTEVDTLWDAEKNGQISTVPLVNIIRRDHPSYSWIATVILLFTMVSITVSFVVNSLAWKHYLEGIIAALSPRNIQTAARHALERMWRRVESLSINWKRAILFGTSFTFVLGMALLNPKSFLKIMEKVTSLAANGTAAGVCWMLHTSRSVSPVAIPWTLPPWLFVTRWAVLAFFVGAMLYNVVATIAELAGVTWL